MEPTEIWARTFDIVRAELAVPTVWLAMQAAKPLAVDGNYFVAALSHQDEYLESHLQTTEATLAIEEALRTITGRVLAFRLIIGDALSDWEAQKALGRRDQPPRRSPAGLFPLRSVCGAAPGLLSVRVQSCPRRAGADPHRTSSPGNDARRQPNLGKTQRAAVAGV